VAEYVEESPTLIVVCANTSRSEKRYGILGTEFYSIIDGAFASMLILLSVVDERISAGFVGPFEDDKASEILKLFHSLREMVETMFHGSNWRSIFFNKY
jgi:nitroreductase